MYKLLNYNCLMVNIEQINIVRVCCWHTGCRIHNAQTLVHLIKQEFVTFTFNFLAFLFAA